MDPLSISASIAGLVTITEMIAGKSYKYIKDARGATKEVKKLLEEITELFGILNSLRLVSSRYENEDFECTMQSHHIHSCHSLLERIKERLDKEDPSQVDETKSTLHQKASKLGRTLSWPFSSTETKSLIAEVAAHKSTMSLALAADGMSALIQALSQQKVQGDDIIDIRDNVRAQRAEMAFNLLSKERRNMLNAIAPYDPSKHQEIAIKLRQPGTGVWFTEGPEFRNWLDTPNAKMWLYGIPGAGKTVLTSSIVQAAKNHLQRSDGIAFFYCDYKDPRTHDPLAILGALMKQLALQDERCLEKLEKFYKKHHPDTGSHFGTSTTPEELCALLQDLSLSFDDVLIVIDALDECGTNRSHIVELLASLHTGNETKIKTLFTSRQETDIEVHLDSYEKVSIAATSSDLRLYVASEIDNRTRKKALRVRNPELKKEIMDRLIDGAQGMFRWVTCQFDYLCELNTDKAIRRALHSLPPTLFATYERILDRVNASNEHTQLLVQRVLTWIICSNEPLPTKQLLEAVSIEESDTKLDRDAMPDEEGILQWCSSLIRRTPDGQTLELAHFTVEEFLLAIDCSQPNSAYRRYSVNAEKKNLSLAKFCLKYLEFEDFQGMHWTRRAELDDFLKQYPFYQYAAYWWDIHAIGHFEDEEFIELAKILFDPCKTTNFLYFIQWWRLNNRELPETLEDDIDEISNIETLHIAACFSLYPICEWLIKEKIGRGDINKLSKVGTPLYCALIAPYETWDHPDEISPGSGLRHILVLASARERTLNSLLDAGASMTCTRSHPDCDLTPLAVALRVDFGWGILCERGALVDETCLDVLELQLERDYDEIAAKFLLKVREENLPVDRSRYVNLALQIDETRQKAVDMMIGVHETTNKQVPAYNPTILISAASVGQLQVVRQLLERPKVDINLRDPQNDYRTALHGACQYGQFDIVKLLVAHGASVDAVDEDGWTPFHLALISNDLDSIKFMLQSGADMNKVFEEGYTALHLAACGNSVPILECILHSPLNNHSLSEQDKDGLTPLLDAVKNGAVDTVQYFLKILDSAEVLRKTKDGRTCLHCAVKSKSSKMISLFRDSCISRLHQTDRGFTALHYAIQSNDPIVLQTFLDQIDDTTLVTPNPFQTKTMTCKPLSLQNLQGAWTIDCSSNPRGLNLPSQSGETALQLLISARTFSRQMFHDLVSRKGMDLELRDKQSRTPLVALASCIATEAMGAFHQDDTFGEAFEQLLDLGVDINSRDAAGCTALHHLCRAKTYSFALTKAMKSLLRHDKQGRVQVDIFDNEKETALQLFFKNMSKKNSYIMDVMTSVALHLLDLSPKTHLDQKLPDGNRLLNLAIISMNDQVVKKLLEFNVNLEERDNTSDSRSPLELLCIYGTANIEILRDFIHKSKDISDLDTHGMSLLHLASDNDHLNIVQELLDAGIDVNILSGQNLTPLTLAAARGRIKIVELLLKHDSKIEPGTSWYLIDCVSNVTIYKLLEKKGVFDWTETWPLVFFTHFVPWFSTNKPANAPGKWVSILIHNITPLHHFAFTGRLGVFRYFIDHSPNININQQASQGLTALFFAVLNHKREMAGFLISLGAKTDSTFGPGWSLLHLAAYLGNSSMVDVLLSHGADPSALDDLFLTPSNLALQQQHTHLSDILKNAEQSRPRLDEIESEPIKSQEVSPILAAAIQNNNLEVVQRLVQRGFNIHGVFECGCTPLILATYSDSSDWLIGHYLLDHGASIEGVTCVEKHGKRLFKGFSVLHYFATTKNEKALERILEMTPIGEMAQSVSPMHLAAYNGELGFLQDLFRVSKDPKSLIHARTRDTGGLPLNEEEPQAVFFDEEEDVWRLGKNIPGGTPLHFAAANGHINVVEFLVKEGANIEARDEFGLTAIQHAVRKPVSTDIFELLAVAGANVNTRDSRGETPFMRTAREGATDTLKVMLKYDVEIAACTIGGETALHLAVYSGEIEAAELLISLGLGIMTLNVWGRSAIQIAVDEQEYSFASRHLPEVDFHVDNYEGSILNTATANFAKSCNDEFIKKLLERAPNNKAEQYFNLRSACGTPLYCSAFRGNISVMESLILKGAQVNLVGGPLGTPLIAACTMGRVEAVSFLLKKGATPDYIKEDGTVASAIEAARDHDEVLLLLERLKSKGIESLDEELPRRKADISRVDEILAAFEARKIAAEGKAKAGNNVEVAEPSEPGKSKAKSFGTSGLAATTILEVIDEATELIE